MPWLMAAPPPPRSQSSPGFFPLCVLSFAYKDTCRWIQDTTSTGVTSCLDPGLNHFSNDSISKDGLVLRFWVDMDSAQPAIGIRGEGF